MQWGWLDNAVWFQGDLVDEQAIHFVGLGGSRHHLIGNPDDVEDDGARRSAREIGGTNRTIYEATKNDSVVVAMLGEVLKLSDIDAANIPSTSQLDAMWPLDAMRGAEPLFPESIISTQSMNYLAVPLAEARVARPDHHPVHGIIGTPLYISLG